MKIGQQLAETHGHRFTLLLSKQETYSLQALRPRLSKNTTILLYDGDPEFVMFGKRAEDKDPKTGRDPVKVSGCCRLSAIMTSVQADLS